MAVTVTVADVVPLPDTEGVAEAVTVAVLDTDGVSVPVAVAVEEDDTLADGELVADPVVVGANVTVLVSLELEVTL
ncbi:MAG: hypothetical protein P4L87_10815 [Formivibrio sp.]|nr:hypothetical protein [Formivibrio sp.]